MKIAIHKLYKIRYLLFLGWVLFFVAPLAISWEIEVRVDTYNQYIADRNEIESMGPISLTVVGVSPTTVEAPWPIMVAFQQVIRNPINRVVGLSASVALCIVFLVLYPYSVGRGDEQ